MISETFWQSRKFALWLSTTPFDGPVVPEVKRITDGSCAAATWPVGSVLAAASAAS